MILHDQIACRCSTGLHGTFVNFDVVGCPICKRATMQTVFQYRGVLVKECMMCGVITRGTDAQTLQPDLV